MLLQPALMAEVIQSSAQGASYWAVRDGAETRVGGPAGAEMVVELPPGAMLLDLEPTQAGWMASGHMPLSDGTELLLVEERDGQIELLAIPERSSSRFRGQPALLMERDRLTGLVWAEGDGPTEYEIWAASWNGSQWGATELVSPQGPGSQLAPVGIVLEDGSWLAVWPAFDGTDDEIRWSRRVDGRWSSPERVHPDNAVPDVIPDVIAIDGGALVVWSWFDGNDYRLRTSRFAGGIWSDIETFGEKGSIDPGLVRIEDGARLLYKTVNPATWTVRQLDRNGLERRQAVLSVDTNDRPLLFNEDGDQPRLHWPELQNRDLPPIDRQLEWQDQQ